MSEPTYIKVRKIIAYILAGLILIFSIVAILAIWDIIEYRNLVARMFQSLMVVLAASAVIVLIFAILDRSSDREEPKE
jgi:ABC-type Na+ efflux pump permease subunit